MAVCDKLASFELTREQLLEEDASKVDSTTTSKPPEKCRKVVKQPNLVKMAVAEAAKARAKAMFSTCATDDSDAEPDDLLCQLAKQKREIKQLQKQLKQQDQGECICSRYPLKVWYV